MILIKIKFRDGSIADLECIDFAITDATWVTLFLAGERKTFRSETVEFIHQKIVSK